MQFKYTTAIFHYWEVIPGKFIAGQTPVGYESYASKQYLKHLLNLGIRTFISLQEEDEVVRKSFSFYHDTLENLAQELNVQTSFVRIPIFDGSVINDATMMLILDIIDNSIAHGQPVYLHCAAGNGRTGTVVGCWLARHGTTGHSAIRKIRELREHDEYLQSKAAPGKPAQINKVLDWTEGK